MTDSFIGYMCKTDFEHDARGAHDGARIYPSENALRQQRSCVAECGVVAVTVSLHTVIQESDYSGLTPKRIDPG